MNSERYDNIEYNDNWQSIPVQRAEAIDYSDEDYADNSFDNAVSEDSEEEEYSDKKFSENPQPVIKLQFFISLIVVVLAFLLKNFGGEIYQKAKEMYFTHLNKSIVVKLPESFTVSDKVNGDGI